MENEFSEFRNGFASFAHEAPHWQLKAISRELQAAMRERFTRQRPKKCELVDKAFTDQELAQLLAHVDDQEARACFLYMAVLGLRIGELVKLRGLDLQGGELIVRSAKGSYHAQLRVPPALLALVPSRAGQPGQLFRRSAKQLRDCFIAARKAAGLSRIYGYSEPGGRAATCRPLFRLSLHSLRHYAIRKVYDATRDPDLTRRFARHRKLQTTLEYFSPSRKEELEHVLEQLTASPQFAISGCGR